MELLVALTIGVLTAVGIYLMLRQRSFPVILGLTFLSYAVNLFLFASGRLALNAARSSARPTRRPTPCRRRLS